MSKPVNKVIGGLITKTSDENTNCKAVKKVDKAKLKKNEECVELKNIEYKNMLLNHPSNAKKSKATDIDIGEFLNVEKS